MNTRLTSIAITAVLSVSGGLAAAAPASAATYPSAVRSEYLSACKKAARGEGVSSRDARVYCQASLKCLQRELTLRQFERFDRAVRRGDRTPPYLRTVNRCIKEAARAV